MDSNTKEVELIGSDGEILNAPNESNAMVVTDNRAINPVKIDSLAIQEMLEQRELMRKFIFSQLKEAPFKNSSLEGYGEGDYGIIPGTKKKTLLKPGAEKLLRLFCLGVRFDCIEKVLDSDKNYASFSYKCQVYSLKTDRVISEGEGSANNFEKRWKQKGEWVNGQKNMVDVPVHEQLNTLQKMAQKRAFLMATTLATGCSEFFTYDLEQSSTQKEQPKPQQQLKPQQAAVQSVPNPEGGLTTTSKRVEAHPPSGQGTHSFDAPFCCGKPMVIAYKAEENGIKPYLCLSCRKKVIRQAS